MPTSDEITDRLTQGEKRWNKIYRSLLLFFAVITTIGVIISVRQVFLTTSRVDQSTQEINRNMACIVSIFAQPNRQQITVDNINKCILVRK